MQGGWRDGSAIQSAYCSKRGPEYRLPLTSGRAQTPGTPALKDPMFPSGLRVLAHTHIETKYNLLK